MHIYCDPRTFSSLIYNSVFAASFVFHAKIDNKRRISDSFLCDTSLTFLYFQRTRDISRPCSQVFFWVLFARWFFPAAFHCVLIVTLASCFIVCIGCLVIRMTGNIPFAVWSYFRTSSCKQPIHVIWYQIEPLTNSCEVCIRCNHPRIGSFSRPELQSGLTNVETYSEVVESSLGSIAECNVPTPKSSSE